MVSAVVVRIAGIRSLTLVFHAHAITTAFISSNTIVIFCNLYTRMLINKQPRIINSSCIQACARRLILWTKTAIANSKIKWGVCDNLSLIIAFTINQAGDNPGALLAYAADAISARAEASNITLLPIIHYPVSTF
jgi:hypothetical protein